MRVFSARTDLVCACLERHQSHHGKPRNSGPLAETQDTYLEGGNPPPPAPPCGRRPLAWAFPSSPAEVKGAEPGAPNRRTRLSTLPRGQGQALTLGLSERLSFLPDARLAGPAARPEPAPRVAGQTLFTLPGGC